MAHWKMKRAAATSGLYALAVGMAATYSSTAVENMMSDSSVFKPDANEKGWIGSILGLGALVGGIFAGLLCEKIGRKGVMMFTTAPFVAGWFLIAFAQSLTPILIGRFITGICCGLICVVTPMYLIEISLPENRGEFGSYFQFYITIGVVLVSSLGMCLTWNWVAFSGAVVTTIAVVIMCFMPESPRWLVAHKKVVEATNAIRFLRGCNVDTSVEYMSISESLISESRLSLRQLFTPPIYRPALLSFGLVFFQQLSGSNAILFYTVSIFKQAENSFNSNIANLLVACAMLFFTAVSSRLMDICGRRKLLLVSGFVMFLALCSLGAFTFVSSSNIHLKLKFSFIPVLCLMVYIASFSLGFGPIPWLMMAELNPMKSRGVICGISTALCWTLVFIVTKSYVSLQYYLADYTIYWIYGAFCLISCYFTYAFLPETKGKTLDEISRCFTSRQNLEKLENEAFVSESGSINE